MAHLVKVLRDDDVTPPDGTFVGPLRRYEVVLFYVEPEYALHRGIEVTEYHATFELEAPSEEAAVSLAKAQFQEAARRATVSWPRKIRSASCRVLSPC